MRQAFRLSATTRLAPVHKLFAPPDSCAAAGKGRAADFKPAAFELAALRAAPGDGLPWRTLMEYGSDWPIIERSGHDARRLCLEAGIGLGATDISPDATGLTLLVRVLRPRDVRALQAA